MNIRKYGTAIPIQRNWILSGSSYGTMNSLKRGQLQSIAGGRLQIKKDRQEKIATWKKKAWYEFCREVMKADTRFTIQPYSDYPRASEEVKQSGVFTQMCLVRSGTLADVYIIPPDVTLGFVVDAGSVYNKLTLNGFPSKTMAYVAIKASDELERQFCREVVIQASKIGVKFGSGKGGSNEHNTTSTTRHTDDDELPTSSDTD